MSFGQPDETYYIFDLGFYFMRFAALEDVRIAIESKRSSTQEFLKAIKTLEEENPGRWPFAYQALAKRGRMLAETNLSWYEEVLEEINRRIKKKRGSNLSQPVEEAISQ